MRGDIALFLGLVGIIGGGIIAAVFFFFGSEDGDTNPCDRPLPPLMTSDISQRGFQEQDAGMAEVIRYASQGNLPAAEDAFLGDVHNFTHNVDPPLRAVDEGLAVRLCQSVIRIEEELISPQARVDVVALEATRIREILRDAAEALGYAAPGR